MWSHVELSAQQKVAPCSRHRTTLQRMARTSTELLLLLLLLYCSPLRGNTLALLNQSRISTAACTSQHIQQMEREEEEGGRKKKHLNQAWHVGPERLGGLQEEEGLGVRSNEAFALSAQDKLWVGYF